MSTKCIFTEATDVIHAVTREKPIMSRDRNWNCGRDRVTCYTSHSVVHPPGGESLPFQTFTMYQSVLQRVGSIPELLDLIFDHLDPTFNANNAVVCKVWSEVARDKLWREVCSPTRLLSILAPISTFTGVSSMVVIV